MADAVMTTNEVAEKLGTDPKTLRKFFRSDKCDIEPVGQGKRYAITAGDIAELKKAFGAWSGGKAKKADDDAEPTADKPAKAKTSSRKKKADPEPVLEDPDEEFDDLEPTADALEEIEDVDDLELD